MLFLLFGIPLIGGAAALFLNLWFATAGSGGGPLTETLALYAGFISAATNLPATLLVSEALFIEENAIFATSQTIGSTRVWLPLPWPLFILFHLLVAYWLYRATVRRVRRVSDK